MTEKEKNQEVPITKMQKQEIAEVTQLSLAAVNDVLFKHKYFQDFHQFLKERRARNQPMPESSDDLMMIYRMEKPEFMQPKMRKGKRFAPKVHAQALYRKHS